MASQTTILKRYEEFSGLDLRSGDLLRNPLTASEMLNAQKLRTGTLTSRKGYMATAESAGGLGTFVYNNIDTVSGQAIREILSASTKLNKLVTTNVTINYDESRDAAVTGYTTIEVYKKVKDDSSEWELKILADSVEIYTKDLGKGFDEASTVTLADLKTDIDALDDFLMTITGSTTIPAAFIPPANTGVFDSSGDFSFEVTDFQEVNSPSNADDSPFTSAFANRNESYAENISAQSLRNVMYFGTGVDELHKYDGSDCYRAGMPKPPLPTLALVGSGSITDTSIIYMATYIQQDAKGNIVEGIRSTSSAVVSPTSQNVNVTVTNIANTTGFNTDCAVASSSQSGVNIIAVDDGSGGNHTMKVGQQAYFYDGVSSEYVSRNITAVGSFSITIDGTAVDVANNAVISNNLKIAIYRTRASGDLPYLVAEIPNNSFSSTQVFLDDTADVGANAEYLNPADIGAEHGLPPKCKYLAVSRGSLIMGGNPQAVNTTYFSDIDSPEYFPSQFSFEVFSGRSEGITGVGSFDEYVYVFKEQSAFTVVGDLTSGQFRVDELSESVGCSAHATIVDTEEGLLVTSYKGIYEVRGPSGLVEISNSILPLFTKKDISDDRQLSLKRAVAAYDAKNQQYLLYIPTEEVQTSNIVPNTNSIVLSYDLYHVRNPSSSGTRLEPWYMWTNMNCAAGLVVDGDDMFFQERRWSTVDSTVRYTLYSRLNTQTDCDYADNLDPIEWEYLTGWETFGEPEIYKQFLRGGIYSLDAQNPAAFTLDIRTEINFIPNESITTATVDFSDSGAGGWGRAGWSTTPWGAPITPYKQFRMATGRKTKSLRQRWSHNTLYAAPFITGAALEVTAPYKIDMQGV